MKFLSIVILLALMAWSWEGYKSTSGTSVVTHLELQNELKDFIANYIQQNVATSSNIHFIRFWTEPTNTKEVRAVFEYSFDTKDENQEVTTTQLKGFAYLNPKEETNEWSLDRVEINDQVIEFQNGSVVTSKAVPQTAEPAPSESEEHQ